MLLEDGRTLLCAYPEGHGKGPIVVKRSRDGGRTWSERLPTPASFATSLETPTLHHVAGPDGGRRLLLFSGLYPIRLAVSDDDGGTWSELAPIGAFGGIVAMSSLLERANGEIVAFFHDDGRFLRAEPAPGPAAFRVYSTVSADHGGTWSEPQLVAHHAQAHLCEPGLVTAPDGKEIALLLRENSRRFRSFVCASSDEGRTWSAPRELHPALTGDRHVARRAPSPDGRLFVSFRDMLDGSPTRGDWIGWVGTWDDVVRGRAGEYRVRLADNRHDWDCGYAGVELLPDGTFVCTSYGRWEDGEEPFVITVRFTLEELDVLARPR